MALIKSYILKQKNKLVVSILFTLGIVGLTLWQPLILKETFWLILYGNRSEIWTIEIKIFVVSMILLVLELLNTIIAVNVSRHFSLDLREGVLAKSLAMSLAQSEETVSSQLSSRLTQDIMQIQNLVMIVLQVFLKLPLILVGSLAFALWIFPRAWFLVVGLLVVTSVLCFLVVRFVLSRHETTTKARDRFVMLLRESFLGIRLLKNYGKENARKHQLEQVSDQIRMENRQLSLFNGVINHSVVLLMNLGILIGMNGLAEYITTDIDFVSGGFTFILYLIFVVTAITTAVTNNQSLSLGVSALKRVLPILATSTTAAKASGPASNQSTGLVVENVGYIGRKGDELLAQLNFQISSGEAIGILGPSSGGKTILARLLMGLYQPTYGAIYLDGTQIQALPERSQKIGYVPQEITLFSGTIEENLCLGETGYSQAELAEVLQIAKADTFVDELPKGIQTLVSEGGRNFSGGQKQRLAIARALLRRPHLLVLDDATSALDYVTEHQVLDSIRNMYPKMMLVLITQRASVIHLLDKIFLLEEGKITVGGSHEEVLAQSGFYQRLQERKSQEGGGGLEAIE